MKKIFFFGLIIFLLSFGFVLAQENNNIQINIPEQYLTPIEIKDISLNVDSGKNLVFGSFVFKNRSSKPLPEVGYTVRLKKAPQKVGIVEDAAGAPTFSFQQSSEEFFYYQPQEERKFSFSLSYPASIQSGTYQIVISSHDKIMNFFGSIFKEMYLEGKNELVYLDPQKCVIHVNNFDFYLNEGPPVEQNSQVPVICEITNPLSKTSVLTPEIEVAELMVADFANSVYYKKDNLPSFTLQPKENKKITFNLTAPQEARTYNTVLTLLDENKNPVSNKLSLRYVVKGEGARIAKTELDKTYYVKGEIAKVAVEYYASSDLHWLPENTPGDGFSDPNMSPLQANLFVKIIGDKGLCGQSQKPTPEIKTALGTIQDKLEIPISKNCPNPKVQVSLGENGKNYSEYQLAFKTDPKDIPAARPFPYLYLVFGFIILAAIYFIKTRFKTKFSFLFVIFVLAVTFIFIGAQTAMAGGCSYSGDRGTVGDGVSFGLVMRGQYCAYIVENIMIQNVSFNNQVINGSVNLTSVDYASGDNAWAEEVALTYYIKDSQGNFIRQPNQESSFLDIKLTEDQSRGGGGTPHILSFSINVSDLSPGSYTVYIDIRPSGNARPEGKPHEIWPRNIDGYLGFNEMVYW
ncbi:MAG: hypothetical protein ACK4NX_01900, partial [Candidatus Paceibacteria bacterium]